MSTYRPEKINGVWNEERKARIRIDKNMFPFIEQEDEEPWGLLALKNLEVEK